MKKILFPIFWIMGIGAACAVIFGSFYFTKNFSFDTKVPARVEEIAQTDEQKYFSQILAQYSLDKFFDLGDTVWMGIRAGKDKKDKDKDPTSNPDGKLSIYAIEKSSGAVTEIAQFTEGPCDSVDWELAANEGVFVIREARSPCESMIRHGISVYGKEGWIKLRAHQSSDSSSIDFSQKGTEYSIFMDFDRDCSKISSDFNSEDSWKNPPVIKLTGLTLFEKSSQGKENNKKIIFEKSTKVTCNLLGYDLGFGNPSMDNLDYRNKNLTFNLADGKSVQVNLNEIEKNFESGKDGEEIFGITIGGE